LLYGCRLDNNVFRQGAMKTFLKIFGLALAIQTGLAAIKTETVEYKEGDTTIERV